MRASMHVSAALVLGGCLGVGLVACESDRARPQEDPPIAQVPLGPDPEPAPAVPALPLDEATDHKASDVPAAGEELHAEVPDEEPLAPNVKLRLEVHPKVAKAMVKWGRTRLGLAPIQFERPRNSGPVDIVITADGFLPYHTRLFTDRGEKLIVRLVPPNQANTLIGYKHTRDAGAPVPRGDAGMPPPGKGKGADAGTSGPEFVVPKAVQF